MKSNNNASLTNWSSFANCSVLQSFPLGAIIRRFAWSLCLVSAVVLFPAWARGRELPVSISPKSVLVGSGQTKQFAVNFEGNSSGIVWLVNGMPGGNKEVGTIDLQGNYTAPEVKQNANVIVGAIVCHEAPKALELRNDSWFRCLRPNESHEHQWREMASASVDIIATGDVSATQNVQVAQYTITAPRDATVEVRFGVDDEHTLATWAQPAPAGGGEVTILVAGMMASRTYHMHAILKLRDGIEFEDCDHLFTTGDLPVASLPSLVTTTTAGGSPQGGVELLDLVFGTPGNKRGVVVSDLSGNVLWTYDPGIPGAFANPIKLMPNGHFLINFSAGPTDGTNSVLQEVSLGGKVVWQMTAEQLNERLAVATCAGCNVTVVGTHHDFAMLHNGHLILIASVQKVESGLTGYSDPVTVTGDVLIDLDRNHQPVWLWSSFDHLDLNRHPLFFPDWTHSNSVVYSPDDKSLILSMRHQDWVIKIDYNDGEGMGSVLWRLGYQGDFTLEEGIEPQDWFYAQHDVNIVRSKRDGVSEILLFDNGNQRVLNASGAQCGGSTPCESRVPLLELDEKDKTATIKWSDQLAPVFSNFGGSSRLLTNGNVEFDECGITSGSAIYEVTMTSPPQTVWQMQISGQFAYRGFRIPSLYPGIQW